MKKKFWELNVEEAGKEISREFPSTWNLVQKYHGNQTRKFSNESVITGHLIPVAQLTQKLLNEEKLNIYGVTALLHDTIEDSKVEIIKIKEALAEDMRIIDAEGDPDIILVITRMIDLSNIRAICTKYFSKTDYMTDKLIGLRRDRISLAIKIADMTSNVISAGRILGMGNEAVQFAKEFLQRIVTQLNRFHYTINVNGSWEETPTGMIKDIAEKLLIQIENDN